MAYPFIGDEANAARLAGCTVPQIYDLTAAADAVVRANLGTSGLSVEVQGMICEFLAAHYFTMGGGVGGSNVVTAESLGDASWTYASASDLSDLRSSRFGRIAVELDTTGTLGESSKPKPVFHVL